MPATAGFFLYEGFVLSSSTLLESFDGHPPSSCLPQFGPSPESGMVGLGSVSDTGMVQDLDGFASAPTHVFLKVMSEPTPVRTDVVGGIPQLSLSVPAMKAVFDSGVATSTSSIEVAA